jgi:beta-lactamase regulating signal transducer with metallopeptidase domain
MIAVWMLYCALWTLWLSCVAAFVERIMVRSRAVVRWIWVAAFTLSLAAPVVAGGLQRQMAAPVAALQTPAVTQTLHPRPQPRVVRTTDIIAQSSAIDAMQSVAARADRPLLIAWITLSLCLLAYLGGGLVRLTVLRRRWRTHIIEGEPVVVSDDTGPALVGFYRPVIVIPDWALSLDPRALSLMLRHEIEHRESGDTRLLMVAQILVALMPWNVGLWWQLRRLRLAIELDCDARVLRKTSGDVASYGRLLIELGRTRRHVLLAGVRLADHATNLEARIRGMTERARMTRSRATALSALAGVAAIALACQVPAPPTPAPRAVVNRLAVSTDLRTDPALRYVGRDTPATGMRGRVDIARARELSRFAIDTPPRPARDTAARGQRQNVDTLFERLRRLTQELDTIVANDRALRGLRRMLDSLTQERGRLAQVFTPDHPQLLEIARQMEQLQRQLGRVVDPFNPPISEPACSVLRTGGGSVVRLMISDEAAARGGKIVLTSEAAGEDGVKVEYDRPGPKCISSVPSEIRVYGRGMLEGTPVYVQSSLQTSVLVMSESGKVVAGPVPLANESRRYELAWARR